MIFVWAWLKTTMTFWFMKPLNVRHLKNEFMNCADVLNADSDIKSALRPE